ncbi:MAG: response regulator [Verrucomicrobia bacterium]|nr:response regulator [Verrucomicrobiota bacterium]
MKKVLIVEDDAIIANIYQRKLQMDGFQVQHAADGELAMEMIKCNQPDIILLDLQLPKANGIEVLRFIRAREESKTLPVVVFTNSYLGTMVQSAWKAGANKCLTKAICTPKQVSDVLRATLAGEDSVGGPPPGEASTIKMVVPAKAPAPAAAAGGTIKMAPLDSPPAAKAEEASKLSGLLKMTSQPKPAARAPQVPKSLSTAAARPGAGDIPLKLAGEGAPIAMQVAPAGGAVGFGGIKMEGLSLPGAPAMPASPAQEYIAPSEHTLLEVEANFQHELRRGFSENFPQFIGFLRQRLQAFVKNESDTANLRWMEERSAILFDMYRKTHSLTSGAGVAGCPVIARLSSPFEALLTELYENPKSINPSAIRTLAQTVDFLAHLSNDVDAAEAINLGDASVLVVDDEALSRKAVMRGLEKAELKAMDVADSAAAFEQCKKQTFDLIFLDIDMPGMNGYDLCKQIRSQPQHAKTPVVFVTGLTDFGSRAKSTMSGGTDLIGKPFPIIELAVKALTFLMKAQFKPGAKPA